MTNKTKNPPTMIEKEKANHVYTLDLYDTIVREWASDAVHFPSKKQKDLAHYLALGIKPRQAALRSGYSRRFANSGVYQLLKINKKFRTKVDSISKNFRDSYLEFTQSVLPDIALIERRELQELLQDPDRLNPVNAKLMRDLKRSARVLDGEYGTTINYHQVNAVVQQIFKAEDEGRLVEFGPPDSAGPGMVSVTIHDEDAVVDAEATDSSEA